MINNIWQKAHSAIDGGYSQAISHYQVLKDNFIEQLNRAKGTTAEDFLKECEAEAKQQEQTTQQYKDIEQQLNDLRYAVTDYMSHAGRSAAFRELKAKWQKDRDNKITYKDREHTLARTSIQNTFQNFMASENLNRKIMSLISSEQQSNEKAMGYYYGFLRGVIYDQLTKSTLKTEVKNYVTGLIAESKEIAEVNAFNKVLEQYDMRASQSGQNTNEKGQQIKYDYVFYSGSRRLNSNNNLDTALIDLIAKQLDTLAGENIGNGQSEIVNFGVQSKSWFFPTSKQLMNPGVIWSMKFGNYADGVPQGEEAHYWHAGVRNAMNKILNIMGPGNVIYTLGNSQMMWTVDLLTTMRASSLVLGYYWEKGTQKITSGEIHGFVHQHN